MWDAYNSCSAFMNWQESSYREIQPLCQSWLLPVMELILLPAEISETSYRISAPTRFQISLLDLMDIRHWYPYWILINHFTFYIQAIQLLADSSRFPCCNSCSEKSENYLTVKSTTPHHQKKLVPLIFLFYFTGSVNCRLFIVKLFTIQHAYQKHQKIWTFAV